VERPWTPGDAEQAEDRCHRIGMTGSLTSHWMQLGAADHLVDEILASKAKRISQVLRSPTTQEPSLSALVRDLLERW
jgi:hypothetical protein